MNYMGGQYIDAFDEIYSKNFTGKTLDDNLTH